MANTTVRKTGAPPTHILLFPDSLPPPERFHLKCSFEFYCRALISHIRILCYIEHSLLQWGSDTHHCRWRFCQKTKNMLKRENILELCTFTFSAPSSPLQPPLTWSEWSHLYWTTFSSEYNSIFINSTVLKVFFWRYNYLSGNVVLCTKLVLLFSLWQEINDCWLNIDVTIS